MGAFGVQVFDEDGACDSLARCVAFGDGALTGLVPQSIAGALESEYLEVDDCGEVLAVSVLLIALSDFSYVEGLTSEELGKPYREKVETFVKTNKEQWDSMAKESKQTMVGDLLVCINKLLGGGSVSESYDLWEEAGHLDDWIKVVEKIKTKLSTLSL